MSWIEYHDALWHHHKIRRLAMLLNTSYTNALGMVSCLWLWTTMNAKDGNLSGFNDDDISDGAKHEGDPAQFVAALVASGVLDADRKVHRWGRYGTRLVDEARLRVETSRLRNSNVTVISTKTDTLSRSDNTTTNELLQEQEQEQEQENKEQLKLKDKATRKKEAKPVRAALVHFGHRFKAVVGETYPCAWAKDYTLMAQVVKQYGEAKTLDLLDLFFEQAAEDTAWHRDKLSVGVFRSQLYRLIVALAQERDAAR